MKLARLFAASVAFVCSAGAALAAEPYTLECLNGAYVTGFKGRAGEWVDRLGIVCARLDSDGTTLGKPVDGPPLVGDSNGGEPTESSCPKGWAVAGRHRIDYARARGGDLLHHIEFDCHPIGVPGDIVSLRFGSTSNAEIADRPAGRRECRAGELVSGVRGRHGLFVDELQLICSAMPIAASRPHDAATTYSNNPAVGAYKRLGSVVAPGGGANPSPPTTPPSVEKAQTTNDTDVYRRVVTKDGEKEDKVTFERTDNDPTHFLPTGFVAPVLAKQGGWWMLDLKNVDFVKGEGWVAADHLKPSP